MYIETEEQAREMCAHAPYSELARAIDSAWCEYALADSIADSLRTRPDDALNLAASALDHPNLVIRRTALLVAQAVGLDPAQSGQAKSLLREHIERMKQQGTYRSVEPMWLYWEETFARIEGRHDAYLAEKHTQYRHFEAYVAQIADSKKARRFAAIHALESVKDPYFTGALARALDDSEDKNVKAALNALVTIRGFDAIPKIARMLRGFWSRPALETLSAFGDRSALTYIFETLENSAPPAYMLDILAQYGRLTVQPLIAALKKCDHPAEYKNGFASVFAVLRCDELVDALLTEAAQDADLSEKIFRLLEKTYPKQLKKHSANTPALKAISPLVFSAFGGKIFKIGTRCEIALTPDGQSLACLAHGKGVTLLDARTGEIRASLAIGGYPRVMALSPDGAYLLTATYNEQHEYTVQVWKWGEWERSLADIAHPLEIKTLAMSWDARFLFIGDTEKVRVVECNAWRDVFTFAGHEFERAPSHPLIAGNVAYRPFTFLRALPNSSSVLIGDWLGWLSVLETETWRETAYFKCDSWAPKFAELSADGAQLVYAGHIGIRVWDTATWQERCAAAAPSGFDYMTLTPDGRYLVVEKNKKIRFLDMTTWKEAFAFDTTPVGQLLVTPDGRELLLSSASGVKAWSLALLYA